MGALQDGQPAGWTGPCRYTLGALTPSDATTYDPPLRVLRCTSNGTVVLVLDGDSASTTVSRAMTSGQEITNLAIKIVKAASTGAYEGYR